MDDRKARRWIGGTIMALWLLSLAVPAAGWGTGPGAIGRGWTLLAIGWMGFLNLQFGWLANPAFLASMPFAIGRDRPPSAAFLLAGVAIALPAMQTLGWTSVQTDTGQFPVVVAPGYYLWLTALFAQSGWLIARALSWGVDRSWTSD